MLRYTSVNNENESNKPYENVMRNMCWLGDHQINFVKLGCKWEKIFNNERKREKKEKERKTDRKEKEKSKRREEKRKNLNFIQPEYDLKTIKNKIL